MRPKKHKTTGSNDLLRARLDQIINMKHELIQLAGKIDWTGSTAGRTALQREWPARDRDPLHAALPKHIYGQSDEGICERCYFQLFTSEAFFQHAFPH